MAFARQIATVSGMRLKFIFVIPLIAPTAVVAQQRLGDPLAWIEPANLPPTRPGEVVTLDLDIAADGSITRCKPFYATVRTSVWKAMCEQVAAEVRYTPAGSPGGKPVASQDRVSFSFKSNGLANRTDFGGALPLASPATWITNDDYPDEAVRKRQQGEVSFTFDINVEGQVSRCEVAQTSGIASLDHITCLLITRRAKFKPPAGPNGEPLATNGRGTFRWLIPE